MAGIAAAVPVDGLGLHERLAARSQSVARLRHAAAAFADRHGASEDQREDIALAVSEAVSNVVKHAYPGRDGDGMVEIEARIFDGVLEVLVSDEGEGMQSPSTSPGMGAGLVVIGELTQSLQIQSRAPLPGVRLRMTFPLD